MAWTSTLGAGQRAERKLLITVAEWTEKSGKTYRAVLGKRTPDSTIDFNAEISTVTDVLGVNYSDIERTQPQQSFDPAYIMGGERLMNILTKAATGGYLPSLNGIFTVYIIEAWMKDGATYYAVKHKHCSIIPQSIGGESYVGLPITVFYSNDTEIGAVNKLGDDFKFVANSAGDAGASGVGGDGNDIIFDVPDEGTEYEETT